LEDDLKAVIKPQYVDQIPKAIKVCSALAYLVSIVLFVGDVVKSNE